MTGSKMTPLLREGEAFRYTGVYFLRYSARSNVEHNGDGDFFRFSGVRLEEERYEVRNYTPKGVRLDDGSKRGRVVIFSTRKQWAHATKKAALQDFMSRNKRHIFVLNRRIRWLKETNEAVREELHVLTKDSRNELQR